MPGFLKILFLLICVAFYYVVNKPVDHLDSSKISFFKSLYYKITFRSDELVDNAKLIKQYEFAINNPHANNRKLIPKIMHHIWLGNKPLPALYSKYIEQCRLLHPDWQHKFWSNDSMKLFPKAVQSLINNASSHHEQSDILRLAVLKQFGGVYLDADIKCLKSFDDLISSYTDIVSMDYAKRRLLNGFVASTPDSKLISDALDNLTLNFNKKFDDFFERKFDYTNPLKSFHRLAVDRTMMPLTNAIFKNTKLGVDSTLLVMPLSYCMEPYEINFVDTIKRFMGYYLKHSDGLVFYDFAKCLHNAKPSNSYIAFPKFEFTLGKNYNELIPYAKAQFNLNKQDKFYKYIYEHNSPSMMPVNASPIIPRILHFIESDKISLQSKRLMQGYKAKQWTKNTIDQLLYKNNLGKFAQTDIANLLASFIILRDEGGVVFSDLNSQYIDHIDDLIYQYSMLLWLNPVVHINDHLSLSSKILASAKDNIFIVKLIDALKSSDPNSLSRDIVMDMFSKIIAGYYPLDQRLFIFPYAFFAMVNLE